jgi:epoxyqueuosine reductase
LSIHFRVFMSSLEVSQHIKQRAHEMGFAACGIAPASPGETHGHLLDWLMNGYNASMRWMARPDAVEKRGDLQKVLPGARSVICVALHYRTDAEWDDATHGKVARYARGVDYHDVLTPRLRELQTWIQERWPCNGRVYVDTGPLLERELARRAGIGWVGKNTMLLSRELGSYFLLGEIVLDLELSYDQPHSTSFCGSCTRCLDACPTDAFVAPFVLDANKCISFHTIENREGAPREQKEKFGDWVFGCDICQEVCPWNHKSEVKSAEPELWERAEFPGLQEFIALPQEEFSRRLKGSPLKRPKRRGMKRNALTVLQNRKRQKAE